MEVQEEAVNWAICMILGPIWALSGSQLQKLWASKGATSTQDYFQAKLGM